MDGGIIVIDKFMMETTLSVTEALVLFIHSQNKIVPIMRVDNKLYLTTSNYANFYRDFIHIHIPGVICKHKRMHISSHSIRGHPVCYHPFFIKTGTNVDGWLMTNRTN